MESPTNVTPPKSNDIEENKLLAVIGYLGILCLIPLLGKKDSAFCQFHGKQGLVLFVAWLILWACNIVPVLGQLVFFLGSVGLLVLVILGMVHTLNGEEWELPLLGKYAKQVKL